MDGTRFTRLTHLFTRFTSRRSALVALLGATLAGTTVAPGAAKSKRRGTRAKKRDHDISARSAGPNSRAHRVQSSQKAPPACVSPPPLNLDLNEFYGVSEQVVAEFCPRLNAGQQWRVPSRWFVSSQPYTPETTPNGFVPVGTPLEDFLAKFAALKYVTDPDTAQEKTTVFPNDGAIFTRAFPQFEAIQVGPITLGKLQPLAVGEHVVELYWVMTALHCDGIGTVVADNCIPAGEVRYTRFAFEVTPGHF